MPLKYCQPLVRKSISNMLILSERDLEMTVLAAEILPTMFVQLIS